MDGVLATTARRAPGDLGMSDDIPHYAPTWPPSARWNSPCAPCADPVVEAVRDRLRARSLAGQAKYSATLDRTDLSRIDWLRHAQEEALDLACYLERLIREFGQLEDDGR